MDTRAALATDYRPELEESSCFDRPVLQLVDQEYLEHLDTITLADSIVSGDTRWFSAHLLPSVQAERERRDEESAQIIAAKQELVREGQFERAGYAYNLLTTAHKLRVAKEAETPDENEIARLERAFHQDCKSHVAEAWRRLSYEYFAEIEQEYDSEKDSYVYEGYVVNEVADNGISPIGSEEVGIEVAVADRRENYTANHIGKLSRQILKHAGVEVASNHLTVLTLSQIDTSPQTMIRGLRFDPITNRRYQEQVGFVKKHLTHQIVAKAYKKLELVDADADPSQLDILGVQVVSPTGEGVMSLIKVLDEIASQETGLNIFMGEESTDRIKDYERVKIEAASRQALQGDDVEALEAEIVRLEAENLDGWQANTTIDVFVTNRILDQVSDDPEAARKVFGEETADKIEQSIELREQGDIDAADKLLDEARLNAPLATVCTAGSCDLEGVSKGESAALIKELGGKEGDTVLKDKVRKCKNKKCKKAQLVYVFNDSEIRTKCMACKEERYEQRSVK